MKRVLLVLCAVALALGARPAFAHVSVDPKEAPRGGTATLTFTVPNEEAPAKTVKVEIVLPEGADFTTVTQQDAAGWTATKTTTSVVWAGGAISGEDKVQFTLTVGPLPATADTVAFKALQTYDNGEVVRWIDIPTGTAEPPHPAPIVTLTGPAPTTTQPPTTTTNAGASNDDEDDDGGPAALILLVALFVGGIGAGIAIGLARRRRLA